jgi:hypothetical protein
MNKNAKIPLMYCLFLDDPKHRRHTQNRVATTLRIAQVYTFLQTLKLQTK